MELDILITELNEQDDADLIALATERMKNYDAAKLITQAQIDAEFESSLITTSTSTEEALWQKESKHNM
jgi:hypothetical protein